MVKDDFSRWTFEDDQLLIESVQHCHDVGRVTRETTFSCPFTQQEVTDRWMALLTDKEISRFAPLFIIVGLHVGHTCRFL